MAVQERDLTISFVRMVAMICIVVCHMMQYYNMELAWWLNVGVQIFLCISGYLYGRKEIAKLGVFYRKNLMKILVDYEIVICVALLATMICADTILTIPVVLQALITVTTIAGGEHLWFIPVILLCYLLTPFYAWICDWAERKSKNTAVWLLIAVAILLLLNEIVYRGWISYFNAAWVNCYLLGFALRRLQQYPIWHKIFVLGIVLVGGVFLSVQISVRYLQILPLTDTLRLVYYPMCDYGHVCFGIVLFCIGRISTRNLNSLKIVQRVLQQSDRYSYQIYLTHHFFILGPFSLMALTDNNWCNGLIALALTIVTAILVQKGSAFFKEVLIQ